MQSKEAERMSLKYFHAVLEERNGEQEYSHNYLIRARSIEEATGLAKCEAKRFYGEDDEDGEGEGEPVEGEENTFEFMGGCIWVSVDSITETTKAAYIERILRNQMIGGYDQEEEKTRIIIDVDGGLVSAVYSTSPDISVEVCDWDNAECDEEAEAECKALKEDTKTMIEVY